MNKNPGNIDRLCIADCLHNEGFSKLKQYSQVRADAIVPIPCIPKLLPHCSDWKARVPTGTAISLIPFGLKFGIKMKSAQAVASIEVPVPTSKGSGDVVDDSFHWIAQ